MNFSGELFDNSKKFTVAVVVALLLSAFFGLGPAHSQSPSDVAIDVTAAGERLGEAIRIPTVARGNDAAPLESVERFRVFLAQRYPAAHRVLTRETTDARGTLYTWAGRNPQAAPILLLAHLDTVPAEEQGDATWERPAFSGVVADGAVWGRGAIDMKGQLISQFEALELLAANGFVPERTILLAIGADEETEGHSAQSIAALLQSRGVRAEFILDEGPVVVDPFELTERRAAFIGIVEKGYGTLLVTATDSGGHSSVPSRRPALHRLSEAIIAIGSMRVDRPLDAHARAMLRALAPDMSGTERFAVKNLWLLGPIVRGRLLREDAGRALLGTTFAPTMVAGSTAENQLPSVATAHINVRIHPNDTPESILADAQRAIERIGNVSVRWNALPRPASAYADTRAPSYQLVSRRVGDLAGPGVPVVPILVFGATDARFYDAISANIYRFQPYVLTQQELSQIHGANEHLSLANLERAILFFYRLIGEAAGASGPAGQ